jgi:hypothetical protein
LERDDFFFDFVTPLCLATQSRFAPFQSQRTRADTVIEY